MPRVEVVGPPATGAGEVPLFSWKPVDAVALYDLVVVGPDAPIWAWRGTSTEIRLGGLPVERPPGLGGPVIAAGSCWSVVALDAAGHVIAASGVLPVSPGEAGGTCQGAAASSAGASAGR
ncbi:MAG: hypothetical protein L0Y54_03955 [Sporichthyaceae bacterium]|nr:hypothetical protein [Sporichthyaceae bacterium]